MEQLNLKELKQINLKELEQINGGTGDDYNFGHKVGNTVRWAGKELWYDTFGFRPVN